MGTYENDPDDIVGRGDAIFREQIEPHIGHVKKGMFVVIDVESGDYEIGERDGEATWRLMERRPEAMTHAVRIGYPTAYEHVGLWPTTVGRQSLDPDVAAMVAQLADEFSPERIVLFGSRARGDAHEDSDVDLLVVMPEIADRHALTVEMLIALADAPLPKDVLVTTPEQFARRGRIPGNALYHARREGIVVYDRAAS